MKDKIFLHGLQAKCIIGIFAWERKIHQQILIDLEMVSNVRKAARRDRIEDALDYKKIAKRTLSFVNNSRFQLIETLAERLAKTLIKEFPLQEIMIRVSKPGAIRNSKNVGIEIQRKKK